MAQTKAIICPNCQNPAILSGNEITCETCDAVFAFTKKDGAKVKEMGPIADHEQRITALEGKAPHEPEPQTSEPGDDEDDDI